MLDSTSSGRDARYQHHHQNPPPIVPPSPTLSNPDMILPFDDRKRESSTPSPPFNLPSLAHLQSFYDNRPFPNDPNADYNMHARPVDMAYGNGNGASTSRQQKKNVPRPLWTHEGNDSANRRLSDIGEEDAPAPRYGGYSGKLNVATNVPRLASSPVLYGRTESEARDNGTSSRSSGSTISGASESPRWDENKNHSNGNAASSQLNIVSAAEENGPDDELSSAILSSEAERILENAKKRLSLMEGNLSRARSTIRASASLPSSPLPSNGTPPLGLGQPVGGLYRSISRADRKSSALRPRPSQDPSQDTANNRHSRVYSEISLPSAAPSNPSPAEASLSRSFSAMGSSSTSSFQNDERSFSYEPTRAYLTHRASVSAMQGPASIQRRSPLSNSTESDSEMTKGLGITADEDPEKFTNMEEFNSIYPSNDPPSRAQSQLQVRDLQDQMKGLRIKISSLKVKTQEDNLRRRSLQSLRTPSPFTDADHWYSNTLELKNGNGSLKSSAGQGRNPVYSRESQNHGHRESPRETHEVGDEAEDSRDVKHQLQAGSRAMVQPADHEDGQSVIESLYEDAEEGDYYNSDIDREALNEILNEPLDDDLMDPLNAFPDVPHHIGATPHEEREDAFDYEHFILHSALGNYTQARLRRSSIVSTTSVETTRPVYQTRHSRAGSAASLSTIATFATATEGRDSDLESVLYWDRKFNNELRNRHHYAEPNVETRHDLNGNDAELPGTPRGQDDRSRHNNNTNPSLRPMSGAATPSSLVSSLVSRSAEKGNPSLNNDDTQLLEQVFKSLGNVCVDLQTMTESAEPDEKMVRVLRRRLDAARRVLDGELDA